MFQRWDYIDERHEASGLLLAPRWSRSGVEVHVELGGEPPDEPPASSDAVWALMSDAQRAALVHFAENQEALHAQLTKAVRAWLRGRGIRVGAPAAAKVSVARKALHLHRLKQGIREPAPTAAAECGFSIDELRLGSLTERGRAVVTLRGNVEADEHGVTVTLCGDELLELQTG